MNSPNNEYASKIYLNLLVETNNKVLCNDKYLIIQLFQLAGRTAGVCMLGSR
jgi:hypothetical protein